MATFTYKSYSFTDKDPIIDQIRTIYSDSDLTYKQLSFTSGVSTTTIHNWFDGSTKRPQAASINAVLRAMGYKLSITPNPQIQHLVSSTPLDTKAPIRSNTRHTINMLKYRKKTKEKV